jgi:hypothetical protein
VPKIVPKRLLAAFRATCTLAQSSQFGHALSEITLGYDRVAPVHGFSLVPDELHGDRPRHARALEISHRRPPEVVRKHTYQPSTTAGARPGFTKALDGLPTSMEHVRNYNPLLTFDCPGVYPLGLQELLEFRERSDREPSPSLFLVVPGSSARRQHASGHCSADREKTFPCKDRTSVFMGPRRSIGSRCVPIHSSSDNLRRQLARVSSLAVREQGGTSSTLGRPSGHSQNSRPCAQVGPPGTKQRPSPRIVAPASCGDVSRAIASGF